MRGEAKHDLRGYNAKIKKNYLGLPEVNFFDFWSKSGNAV